ncbi:MAG: ABC transporter permease [Polyangiaceae bacterium]
MSLFFGALRLALSAIARNKLRAALTTLGILIGVTAVVLVTALAGGAREKVGSQIDSFASNALFVSPQAVQQSGVRGATGRLTEADMRAIEREAVSVAHVAPWLSRPGQVVYGDRNVATELVGSTLQYFPIRRYEVAKGVPWTESDELLKTKVCLLGNTVAEKLFDGADPVGSVIRVAGFPCRVIGVLAAKGNSPFGEDQDDRVMMPAGSFRARVSHTAPGRVDLILVSSTGPETVDRAKRQIEAILRQRHHLGPAQEADFVVRTQKELRETQEGIASALQALLLSVAAVSLVVGGIGVMNIMLVSVAERTREIGIRLSIGARSRDIMVQFLVEAVVLSLAGGVLGVLIGAAATAGFGKVLGFGGGLSYDAVLVAFATSAFVGVGFGFLPARRASQLDPIEALRVE